ncbi:MAG: restriction endonuclease subunit S [Deltaproteobacteria bacterium]|nr:restriction endonuclease subunit S [Deltaproteobacteria bacterium]
MGELKPGWRRVKLGDVVRLNKETCKDPDAEEIERTIGLEHLEPGDLRVRSWGEVSDGTTFTNRVRAGQVLFGKRRAYQRKVAVADFDAVCSGDIYVLESKDPARLLPDLLPFICQTDAFFEHAVGTSAGSLSPRTNWTSLGQYELALPPLAEQRRMLAALEECTGLVEAAKRLNQATWNVLDSSLTAWAAAASERRALQDLCRVPVTYGIVKAGLHVDKGVPYIRVADITAGPRLTMRTMLRTSAEVSQAYARTILEEGDCVVAVKASRGVVGQARWICGRLAGANISRDVARVAPCSSIDPRFLYWSLRTSAFMYGIQARETGWKGDSLREITIAALRTVPVPWVPMDQQIQVARRMAELESAALHSDTHLEATRRMARAAIEAVLGG